MVGTVDTAMLAPVTPEVRSLDGRSGGPRWAGLQAADVPQALHVPVGVAVDVPAEGMVAAATDIAEESRPWCVAPGPIAAGIAACLDLWHCPQYIPATCSRPV
jgi:hypothetical protein